MDKYNLFTNSITIGRLDFVDNELIYNWSYQWDLLKTSVKKIHSMLSLDVYKEELGKIYRVAEFLRKDNPSTALRFYYHFYMSLTADYTEIDKLVNSEMIYEYIDSIELTEVFYNFAKLHSSLGNIDDTIYFASLADKEYSKHNKARSGLFLKTLLDSSDKLFWNVKSDIISSYRNYSNGNENLFTKLISNYQINLDKSEITTLINSLELDNSLYFIKCNVEYSRNYNHFLEVSKDSKLSNILIFKTLGNITWVIENHLKHSLENRLSENVDKKSMSNLIEKLLKKTSKNLSRYYSDKYIEVKAKYPSSYDLNTSGLIDLIEELNQIYLSKPEVLLAHCSLITVLYRNYSAHYMDDFLELNMKYHLKEKIFLTIITTLLVLEKQIKVLE